MDRRSFLASVAGFTAFGAAACAGEPSQVEIQKLIEQLGSRKFREREAASEALRKVGQPALSPLRKAARNHSDAEVRRRARSAADAIEKDASGEIACWAADVDSVLAVAFSNNTRWALSAGWGQTIRLWDVATQRQLRSVRSTRGHVASVAFTPCDQFILAPDDEKPCLWAAATGALVRPFLGHTGWVSCVTCCPDGKRLLSLSYDGTVRLWELGTGKPLRTIRIAKWQRVATGTSMPGPFHVAFAPDGDRFLLCVGAQVQIRTAAGKELCRFEKHSVGVPQAAFSPDGRYVLSGDMKGVLYLWDACTGRTLRQFCAELYRDNPRVPRHWQGYDPVEALAISPDGRRVISGHHLSGVRLWNLATGAELRCSRSRDIVHGVACSRDGKLILAGSEDGTVQLFRMPQ